MPAVARRAVLYPLLVLVALGLAACGSSSKTTTTGTTATGAAATSTATTPTSAASGVLVGQHTSVVINPATSQLLKEHQIVVTAVAPATYRTTLLLPVSGGHIAVATVAGAIEHTGGVRLSHAGKTAQVTSFIVDTPTKQVTALVNGQRLPIFALDTSSEKHQTGVGGTIVEGGLKFTVTEGAATALNGALGVSAFKAGQVFATATLTLAVKH